MFHTSRNDLEDGSATFDVYFSGPDGQELIAEPPSEACAEELAYALNAIRNRFLDCGSDREVSSFACSLSVFLDRHDKKAA
jgi:hypothetical protein